jgi:hypothetical protein
MELSLCTRAINYCTRLLVRLTSRLVWRCPVWNFATNQLRNPSGTLIPYQNWSFTRGPASGMTRVKTKLYQGFSKEHSSP